MEDRIRRYLSLISLQKPAEMFAYPKGLLDPVEVPSEPDMTLEKQILERYLAMEAKKKAEARVVPKPVNLANAPNAAR